ncbi:ethanolamine ammonia-lyase subunit EutC [Salinimonas lutimaris]|uniref:ethanolamine ammonia-lyase subunit EutC n=1 Tax=Salinimonas lutimaris TaxID=914153 RepID=UPI0010C1466F|nr:ethanolamine ammonia-lyase subunit EutC [Salinimonas lutimaris]
MKNNAQPESVLSSQDDVTQPNPWQELKAFTSARIALGRAGTSIPTKQMLAFQLDHARAMDAVHGALDIPALLGNLKDSALISQHCAGEAMALSSRAQDRFDYLQRPDKGRQLNENSWQALCDYRATTDTPFDLAIVVADGLSATAVSRHAQPVIEGLLSLLGNDERHWQVAPVTVVSQGRVAVGDDVAECLNASLVLILIGERPGLTSPDSMGMYLTWQARRGARESSRNCISNVRPQGLNYPEACQKAFYLMSEARTRQLTGVNLKDRSSTLDNNATLGQQSGSSFLVAAPTNTQE